MNRETQGTSGRQEWHVEGEGKRLPVVKIFAAVAESPASNQKEGLVWI